MRFDITAPFSQVRWTDRFHIFFSDTFEAAVIPVLQTVLLAATVLRVAGQDSMTVGDRAYPRRKFSLFVCSRDSTQIPEHSILTVDQFSRTVDQGLMKGEPLDDMATIEEHENTPSEQLGDVAHPQHGFVTRGPDWQHHETASTWCALQHRMCDIDPDMAGTS